MIHLKSTYYIMDLPLVVLLNKRLIISVDIDQDNRDVIFNDVIRFDNSNYSKAESIVNDYYQNSSCKFLKVTQDKVYIGF